MSGKKNRTKPWLQTWGTSVFKVGPKKEANTETGSGWAESWENVVFIKTKRRWSNQQCQGFREAG